ncbi:MAG: ankyrin repeat domain-containing protein, partial [Pseudorhodoplanes sp.]|nr:ankyrin repeat domain-containing protein [Pseudorhodoplanes sp.]
HRARAGEYGFADWAALIAHVRRLEPAAPLSALAEAARAGDVARVERLIANGHDPNDGGADTSPLWEACLSKATPSARLAIAEALLKAGASARKAARGQRPLHAAAARGPVELAELLILHGAIEWEPNAEGRSALDIARRSRAKDKAALVELFDRPVIRDPSFRAAVDAIHVGDVESLERLIDADPRLMTERIREPACYRDSGRSQYFLDPKLFWFVANNPTLTDAMPANIADVARAMIARGVEKTDLDYTLGLAMTSSAAREHGLQIPLVKVLIEAGATPDPNDMGGVLGHGETGIVEYLVSDGMTMTAPIAAALGRTDALPDLLKSASQREIDEALDLAVINNRLDAARMALAAGANPDRKSSQHRHSQPLHQAALHDNVALLELLIAHGARLDAVDDLWGGTPLGWAMHAGAKSPSVIAYLQERMNG